MLRSALTVEGWDRFPIHGIDIQFKHLTLSCVSMYHLGKSVPSSQCTPMNTGIARESSQ